MQDAGRGVAPEDRAEVLLAPRELLGEVLDQSGRDERGDGGRGKRQRRGLAGGRRHDRADVEQRVVRRRRSPRPSRDVMGGPVHAQRVPAAHREQLVEELRRDGHVEARGPPGRDRRRERVELVAERPAQRELALQVRRVEPVGFVGDRRAEHERPR